MNWKLAAVAFGAGVLAVAVGIASAAGLGVLNVRTLGTGSSVVAACDDTIGLSWDASGSPTYSGNATAANSTFTVTKLQLTNVAAACNGSKYSLTIANNLGASLASQSGTLTVTSNTATLTFAAVNSRTIEQVTVTIYE